MKREYRKMARKANGKIREIREGQVTIEVPLPIAEVLSGTTGIVEELSREIGLVVISAVIESEVEQKAGKKHARNPGRKAHWWGSQVGTVCFEGQKVLIDRPRIRSKGGKEVSLETYRAFQNPQRMRSTLLKGMVLGISSRNYEETIEKLIQGYGIKKSSISRHFIQATTEQMKEFLERTLTDLDICVIFIDGIEFKGEHLRAAYTMANYEDAKKSLELTVKYLQRLNPSAARSLEEGLEETLTVHRLGITGILKKVLSSTNPIESCFSIMRTVTERVKRWRKGDMIQRWAVAAILRAEKKFRRVNGYQEIPKLLMTLQRKSIDVKEKAA
jgi:transposase-like protein